MSNAFAITLFCLDEAHASRSIDFLSYAFEQFPDKEYCLLTLPSTSPPISILRNFTVVQPKPGSTFSHVLYLLHRDTPQSAAHLSLTRYTSNFFPLFEPFFDGLDPSNRSEMEACLKSATPYEQHELPNCPKVVAFMASVDEQVSNM